MRISIIHSFHVFEDTLHDGASPARSFLLLRPDPRALLQVPLTHSLVMMVLQSSTLSRFVSPCLFCSPCVFQSRIQSCRFCSVCQSPRHCVPSNCCIPSCCCLPSHRVLNFPPLPFFELRLQGSPVSQLFLLLTLLRCQSEQPLLFLNIDMLINGILVVVRAMIAAHMRIDGGGRKDAHASPTNVTLASVPDLSNEMHTGAGRI